MNSYLDVLFSGLSRGIHGSVGVDFNRPKEKGAVKSNPLQATTKIMPREKAEKPKPDRKKKHKKKMAKASKVRNRR